MAIDDTADVRSGGQGRGRFWRVHVPEPLNAETVPAALAPAGPTPVDAFFVRSHGAVPQVDPETWRLTVDGLVERPLTLSLRDLRTRYSRDAVTATLQCAGNRRTALLAVRAVPGEVPWDLGAIGTADWTGVRLRDVLRDAGVRPEAAHVAFLGADTCVKAGERFGGSVPLAKAAQPEVLLAWAMNGEPLTPDHGAPVRVVVPGYIGARSVKWVERITLQAEESGAFHQRTAYRLLPPDGSGPGVSLGALPVTADVLLPAEGESVPAGTLTVHGHAFAGDGRTVARVDVSTDGGRTWSQAELLEDVGPWARRRWRAEVPVEPGSATLVARAWDSAAATQPEDPAALWNPKGYLNTSWCRVPITVRPA
jgi:sulfite oxidase